MVDRVCTLFFFLGGGKGIEADFWGEGTGTKSAPLPAICIAPQILSYQAISLDWEEFGPFFGARDPPKFWRRKGVSRGLCGAQNPNNTPPHFAWR